MVQGSISAGSSPAFLGSRRWKETSVLALFQRNVHVVAASRPGNPQQPILLAKGFACRRFLIARQDSRNSVRPFTRNAAPEGARSDSHARIVADAFVLPRIVAGRQINDSGLLREP